MNSDYTQKWQKCLDMIRDNVGQEKFDTWFSCAKLLDYVESENKLTIGVPSHFFIEKYEETFFNVFSASLTRNFGPSVSLDYRVGVIRDDAEAMVTVKASKKSHILTNKTAMANVARIDGERPFKEVKYADVDPQLNPIYNFDNYCVGESNKLPYTIAKFIADNPRKQEFNPFFLYGDVGVGKTHLIQAIGTQIKENNPSAKVLYVTLRHFSNQLSFATVNDEFSNFMNWYQHLDVLLIDDLQELSGMEGTMNALFPIFNHLHQNNKKLIFTCDRPPSMLSGITDRLIDRFKWGITEQLPKPDYDLRKKILVYKASKSGLNLSEDVVDYISRTATGSVRELEGIVMGIMTRAIQLNVPITIDLARQVCGNLVHVRTKTINFDMIVEATAEQYKLNPDVIFTKNRVRDISDARQVIMYLARKHTSLSSGAIGQRLNRRHATVLHGVNSVTDRIPYEADLARIVSSIEEQLIK